MRAKLRILPLVIASALFMENMDSTVIATSLPAIANDLGTDPVALKLAFTTYLISLTVFIPVSGWVADRFGARNVFRAAIVVFILGSLACGQSTSLEWLVAARALQGLGGAMMVPVGRIILLRETPKSQMVDALAWLTIPALMGPLIGPPVGGFITTYLDWRWIFWMNVPIGVLGLYLASRFISPGRTENLPGLDVKGFILSGIGLSAVAFGSTIVGRDILSGSQVAAMIIGGLILLVLYTRHARQVASPILDLKLLQVPTFHAGVVGGSLYRIGVGAIPFLLPLMLQLGFGYTAWESGLLTGAAALGSIAMKFSTARLLRRFGFRSLLIVNGVLSSLFIAAYGLISNSISIAIIVAVFVIGGFLRSLQFTALNALSYSDIDREKASGATSFYSVAQQLSLSAGVAIAAMVLEFTQWLNGDNALEVRDFSLAFFVVSGLSLLSVLQYLRLGQNSGSAVLRRDSGAPAG